MRNLFLLSLLALSIAAIGCPKQTMVRQPDYEATRQRAQESHDSMGK